ncbi:MAG: DUF2791 family P-loop domain-containing protein [Lachnospiraceae bacterium]|nr:DUF2791 family P-loop domain-containing protein [Lachnospiraceae bacterium]
MNENNRRPEAGAQTDFNARHVIEALRSGVPSRAVGEYFSEARPAMLRRIQERMEAVRETGRSGGMIFTGRYGEGKTHLLNTAFNMASAENMVVSFVSLGKETPVDKPYLLYPKIVANTYLPGAAQPGFRQKLEDLTQGSSISGELLAYAAKELETDKLYFLLKAFLGTQEEDERYAFLADLEGDFTTGQTIKRSYRRITGSVAKFNQNFSKTKHGFDYFCFLSHLFRQLGYAGWVLLFDEAELIGGMGKKARAKSYVEIQRFLRPSPKLEGVFALFAFSSSYVEDVIDKKKEEENVQTTYAEDPDALTAATATVNAILNAPELAPLTKDEILQVLLSIQEFHGRAYGWTPDVSAEAIYAATEAGGYLLRTKIRAAIEFFDQLYQYGEAGRTRITELGRETFEEDDTPELEDAEEL